MGEITGYAFKQMGEIKLIAIPVPVEDNRQRRLYI
jgi:hypothetical protein